MFICNVQHLATLPAGTVFATYKDDSNAYHVGGMNILVGVRDNEIECEVISSQYHDQKMDSGHGCFMRTYQYVQNGNVGKDHSVIDGIDSMAVEDSDMFAVFSTEDLEKITNRLRESLDALAKLTTLMVSE